MISISFSHQLWIAFKIWLFSVAANTLLGSFYLTGFFDQGYSIGFFVMVGAGYGAVFSFPVFLVLLIIINICVDWNAKSYWIFRIVFISGIALTLLVFVIFEVLVRGLGQLEHALRFIAILSAIIGVASQCKPLFTLGSDFQKLNKQELFK